MHVRWLQLHFGLSIYTVTQPLYTPETKHTVLMGDYK